MGLTARVTFLIIISLVVLWFLFLARAIITPFIIAAIFAYILNPVIALLSVKTKINRIFYIVLFYILVFAALGWTGTFVTKQAFRELQELSGEAKTLIENAHMQIDALPEWARIYTNEILTSAQEAVSISPQSILPLFSGAASRILTLITFLFASFYFLKDGARFIDKLLFLLHKEHKTEAEKLLIKINLALGKYLRGQLLLVLLMAVLGSIMFSILGVRFSLVLGITIGLAEVVPMIGPIIAGTAIALVSVFDSSSRFGLSPLYDGSLVLLSYIILNQLENYLIVPQVMGRATNLHPLMIFFAVLAGGHLFGALGFILAVPIVATLRVVLEYLLNRFK